MSKQKPSLSRCANTEVFKNWVWLYDCAVYESKLYVWIYLPSLSYDRHGSSGLNTTYWHLAFEIYYINRQIFPCTIVSSSDSPRDLKLRWYSYAILKKSLDFSFLYWKCGLKSELPLRAQRSNPASPSEAMLDCFAAPAMTAMMLGCCTMPYSPEPHHIGGDLA